MHRLEAIPSTPRNALRLLALLASGWIASGVPAARAAGNAAPPVAVHEFCAAWPAEAAKIDTNFLSYFPGENGSLLNTPDLSPMDPPKEEEQLALKRLVGALSAKGTRLVLVVPPFRSMLTPEAVGPKFKQYRRSSAEAQRESYRRTVAALATTGAIVPDVLSAALAAGDRARNDYFRLQDLHWRADGAKLTAEVTARAILSQVDLSAYPERKFVSRKTATSAYRGVLRDAIVKICKTPIREEAEPVFVTAAVDEPESGGAADLLGDSGQAVVLAGTSFSREDANYNFGGFLREQLSRDVLNVAVPGGGSTASILSYFASGEYAAAPPAVLIWEVRGHDLPDERFFGQLLGLLEENCAPGSALASASAKLDRGEVQLLSLTEKQRSEATKAYFLDVGAQGTSLNKFRLRLDYVDYTHDDVHIDQTRSTVGAEHYRFPLTPKQLRRLDRVTLRPAATLRGDVSATICAAKLS